MAQVISISGPPGAGKTTLCTQLARAIGAQVVSYDDFETMTRRPPNETMNWLERGAPYGEIEAPGLNAALAAAKGKGAVVFDTPLGRAHPNSGAMIDFAIWIKCPLDVALARKIAQLSNHVGTDHAANFLEWLKAYLGHYDLIVRPACLIQERRVGDTCDAKLDGSLALHELHVAIKNLLSKRL